MTEKAHSKDLISKISIDQESISDIEENTPATKPRRKVPVREKRNSIAREICPERKSVTYSMEFREAMIQAEEHIAQLFFLKGKLKFKVGKLLEKYQKLNKLEDKNYKLMKHTNKLEQTIVCLFRDKEILKENLEELHEDMKNEDNVLKDKLLVQIDRISLVVKQKEQEKSSVVQELENIKSKLEKIFEINQSKMIERNRFKHNKDQLELVDIENMRKEIKKIEENGEKELETLLEDLTRREENCEAEVEEQTKNINQLEIEKKELIIKRDDILSNKSTLTTTVQEKSTEKDILNSKLHDLQTTKDNLEEMKIKTDEQLVKCAKKIAIMSNEQIRDRKIIKDAYDEFARLTKKSKINRNKKMIKKTIMDNEASFKEDLLQYCFRFEKEYQCLLEKMNLFLTDLSSSSENRKPCVERKYYNIENQEELLRLQKEIQSSDEKRMELLKCSKHLEETLKIKDEQIKNFEDQNTQSHKEYNQVLESLREIKRIQHQREAEILEKDDKIKNFTSKNTYLKYSCDRLEEHIGTKEEVLRKCQHDTLMIDNENTTILNEKLDIQANIDQEYAIGEEYKAQIKILAERKCMVDEKLIELREVEKRKQQLQKENSELTCMINKLKFKQKELQDTVEAQNSFTKDDSCADSRYNERT